MNCWMSMMYQSALAAMLGRTTTPPYLHRAGRVSSWRWCQEDHQHHAEALLPACQVARPLACPPACLTAHPLLTRQRATLRPPAALRGPWRRRPPSPRWTDPTFPAGTRNQTASTPLTPPGPHCAPCDLRSIDPPTSKRRGPSWQSNPRTLMWRSAAGLPPLRHVYSFSSNPAYLPCACTPHATTGAGTPSHGQRAPAHARERSHTGRHCPPHVKEDGVCEDVRERDV